LFADRNKQMIVPRLLFDVRPCWTGESHLSRDHR